MNHSSQAKPSLEIPVIDVSSLWDDSADHSEVAQAIHQACCRNGFFYVRGHGVTLEIQKQLELLSHQFFSCDHATKMKIHMALAGRAWRGYFPVKGELTSGIPDNKEGLYFGIEHDLNHPEVKAKTPVHGANLFPEIDGFKSTVLEYMRQVTLLGHKVMNGISLALGIGPNFFHDKYTSDPTILFRIFHYPSASSEPDSNLWGVGEHTDYGLITLLKQDTVGGLQVKSKAGWIDAPPLENSFVCNIGDMLDRMTGGLYRSTPHRVRNTSTNERYSYPLFFDPGFRRDIKPIFPNQAVSDDAKERWDKASVHTFQGTYADYLLAKLSKVFPDLENNLDLV